MNVTVPVYRVPQVSGREFCWLVDCGDIRLGGTGLTNEIKAKKALFRYFLLCSSVLFFPSRSLRTAITKGVRFGSGGHKVCLFAVPACRSC